MQRGLTYLLIIVVLLTACSSPAAPSHLQPNIVSSETAPAIFSPTPSPSETPPGIFSPTPAPSETPMSTRVPTSTFTATPDRLNLGASNFDQFVQVQTYGKTLEKAVGVSLSEIRIDAVAYSPDGRYLAVGGCNGTWSGNCISDVFGGQSFLLILDSRTAKVVTTLPETQVTVTSLAFSSDGERLVYATNPDRISIWDVSSGKIEKVLWQARGSVYRRLAISPDGSRIAEVNSTNLKVWDVASGTVLTQKPGGNTSDKLPRFSADGSRLAAFSTDSGLEITIYDTSSWQPISVISLPGNTPGPLALSPDLKLLATAEGARKVDVLLWDGETGQQVGALHDPLWAGIDAVGFTPDGQLLLISGTPGSDAPYNHPFSVWNVLSRQNLGRMTGPDSSYGKIVFSKDGTAFTTGGALWSLPDEPVLAARAAVIDFLTALNRHDYVTAAASYKPYEGDSDYFNSVGVDAADIPAVLDFVCSLDSQPCMPVREILYAGKDAYGDYGVLVRFTAPDGSIYKDADGFDSFWIYGDINADGNFVFDTLPPFPR